VAKLQESGIPTRSEVREISFQDLRKTLFVRRGTILTVLVVFVAIGIAFCFFPRHFTASGTIWVQPGESGAMQLSSSLSTLMNGTTNDIVASEVLALQSRTLYLEVAKDLDLVHNMDFWGPMPFAAPDPAMRSLDIPKTRDMVYAKLQHQITVLNDGKDEIIVISAKTYSPKLSTKIVNQLIHDYLLYLFQMQYDATKRASGWLVDQLGSLKKKVDQDQTELTDLQAKLGILGFNPTTATYLYGESLAELMKASDQATIERIVAEAKLRYLQESNPNLIEGEISILPQGSESTAGQSLLASLRAAQAQASATYASLVAQYGPNYPQVKQQHAQLDEIDKELKTEQQRILNQAQLSFNAASANEKMTTSKVEQEKSTVFNSHDAMVRFVLLLQDYQSDRDLYEQLISHLQEAGITSGLQAGDIDVVDLADIPGPDLPGPVLIILGAVALGLILGSFLAIWLAAIDQRLGDVEQVEALTGLPLLARLPHLTPDKGTPDRPELPQLLVPARFSHYAEAVQTLRAALLLTRPGAAPKVILISSAVPGEGKSTTAVNLAATFARHGARVLVADCDMRKGTIASRLRLSMAKGLTNVLTKSMSLEDAIQEVPGVPGLFVLGRGPQPPDPAVLISSDEMSQMVNSVRRQYDFVFLDSPPILGIADGLHLGRLTDSVILVIRENVSNRKAVQDTVAMMTAAHLPMSGFVFNDIDPRASSYSYGYSYRNYYRDYYTDGNQNPPVEVSK